MPREVETKELVDDYDNAHQYTVTQHPADEGVDLMPTLLRFIGNSGGPLADAIFGGLMDADEDEEIDLLALASRGSKIGEAITNFGEELALAGGSEFCKTVLKYTVRTETIGGEEVLQKVPKNFSKIYQGNYGELARAILLCLKVNYGPSLRVRFGSGDIMTKVASLMKLVN